MRLIAITLLLAAPLARSAAPLDDYNFVRANGPAEWTASGDFNGDGLLDTVIVDRLTGSYRIGYQAPDGSHAWSSPRGSGIANVSGISVGRLLQAGADALAITAEAANRVNVVSAIDPNQSIPPVSVFGSSAGPNQAVALNIGGAGDTPLHDLVVASAWNGVLPFRVSTIRNTDGATFSQLSDVGSAQRWDHVNRVIFRDGRAPVVAVLGRGATDTLQLISYGGGPAETFLQFTNVTPGGDYAVGRFAATGLAHLLSYRPGHSNFVAYPVLEPVVGTFQPGSGTNFAFNGSIDSLVVLPASAGVSPKILAVLDQGVRAAVYRFDGTNAPTLVQEFFPPAGENLLGATPLQNGGLHLHSGTDGRTRHSQRHSFNSSTGNFNLEHTDALPEISDLSGVANVFQFQQEPFVSATPRLLSSVNAGDWSSLFSLLGGPAEVGITREQFVDSSHGLDNPTSISLGPSHPLAQFGLVNQYNDAVSLFSLAPGTGTAVTELTAQPPGGLQARSVAVTLKASTPGFQILYRLNPMGTWQVYSQPILIFTNSTLQYRARALIGTSQTTIRTEIYSFIDAPSTLDSDSDGVPDYVEVAHGLDPRSGSDADGDGASDLEELLKNTSPSNSSSHPASSGFEQHAAVDWLLTPRPIDGTTGTETAARGSTHVRVFGLNGSELGFGLIGNPPLPAAPGSTIISNIVLSPQHPLLLAATDPHFDIVTAGSDARLGRELVGVLPTPPVPPIRVPYAFGGAGGLINIEAANWVASAKSVYLSATNVVRAQSMGVADTTLAVLLEEKLRRILATAKFGRSNITLFPFRPADAGRERFDANAEAILQPTDVNQPAYDLRQLYHSLAALVLAAPNAQVQSLLGVAREIYRVSSASNNAAPGFYAPPLDVLRNFVRGELLPESYSAAGSFPPATLAAATAGVQFVLENLTSRPVTNILLRVRADTMAGTCTTLETADLNATPVNLFALGGGPFDFPDTFQLLPGTIIQVTGRPDVASTTCAGLNIEVLTVSLEAIPARSDGDADGNLLIDSWEMMFLGRIGANPFGDDDGDGYSNLQEMFEGTDPRDGLGAPKTPIAAIKAPALAIETNPDGTLALEWSWPEVYLSKVQFQVWSTPDLNIAPTLRPLTSIHQGNGVHRATLANPGDAAQFIRVNLLLRF